MLLKPWHFLWLVAFFGSLHANGADECCGRVFAHLALFDSDGALEESKKGLARYPDSLPLRKAHIEVLAASGQENAMSQAWLELLEAHPEEKEDRHLLETMAWGIIRKGAASPSPITVASALLAAQKGADSRGVRLLAQGLRSNNSLIRALSLSLVSQMRDASLCDEVSRLLSQEHIWTVRLEAIKAAGRMHIASAEPIFEAILANPTSAAEEKAFAIEGLVNILDRADPDRIRSLVANRRAGLRLLACQAAAHCSDAKDIPILLPLLQDVNSEVRAVALQVIGILRSCGEVSCDLKEIARRRLGDNDPLVAISAAWLLTLVEPEEGARALKGWLNHSKRDIRLQAAGALVTTGRYGVPLMRETFATTGDPYVRMNLALGLIGQRIDIPDACRALSEGLQMQDRWMWGQDALFKYIAPSVERHREGIPNYPEAVNQMVRLEVLNVLAMMKSSDALSSIRRFLQERNWGISGMAAAVLLSEGNEEAVELVAGLLSDPEPKVRIQAALVLGMLGRDARALDVLHQAYERGDRATKEGVLEAVGRIGQMESVPFLVDKLIEPYQNLRLVAAASLLQCLNH